MENRQIDLFCIGRHSKGLNWPLGKIWSSHPVPDQVLQIFQVALKQSSASGWFLWDPCLGEAPASQAMQFLQSPDDLWHGGLSLGMAGLPHLMDFVAPTWMLNRDPSSNAVAASWRVSLRACLVRTEVIRQVGFLNPDFETLDGAGLEWGHRCISRGVLCRSQPGLLQETEKKTVFLPASDELRFVRSRFGKRWAFWASQRAVLSGYWSLPQGLRVRQAISSDLPTTASAVFQHKADERVKSDKVKAKVSVLIPTIDRYPYLQKLLTQLRHQTLLADEIIIVDQTPQPNRQLDMLAAFRDLPVKILYQEKAGQCSARNAGLKVLRGEYVLFIDDDDEVPVDLIEKHLTNLQRFDAEVSSGVADEVGAGALPEAFTFLRASDVFPTNNSMVRRSALQKSGLFDLAFDHGARADADLGMRLYLSGARMILDPGISVLHHHAPRGGLRTHKARVVTYAKSRHSLWTRNLASVTEIYLALRYFNKEQKREQKWLNILGTFSIHGSRFKGIFKTLIALLVLPDTLWQFHRNNLQARKMLGFFPHIPYLLQAEQIADNSSIHQKVSINVEPSN